MSVLTDRASVAYKLAAQELNPAFRRWLAEHPDTIDADGNQVICIFAPDEPVGKMVAEVLGYTHPVIIASEVDGHLVARHLSLEAPGHRSRTHGQRSMSGTRRWLDILRLASSAKGVSVEYSLVDNQALVLTA
jgi:hypothetical protein